LIDSENSSFTSLGDDKASQALRSSDTAAAAREKSHASRSTVSRVYMFKRVNTREAGKNRGKKPREAGGGGPCTHSSSAADTTPSSTRSKRSVAGLLPTGTSSPEYCSATKHMPGEP